MTHSSKSDGSADAAHVNVPPAPRSMPDPSSFDQFLLWPRWGIAALYWLAQTIFLWMLIPAVGLLAGSVNAKQGVFWGHLHRSDYANALVSFEAFEWIAGFAVAIAVSQAIILLPVRRPAFRTTGGTSLKLAITLVALCMALMLAGFTVSISYIISLYKIAEFKDPLPIGVLVFGPPLVVWIIAWVLVARFIRNGPRETRLARLTSRLFVGTLVETAALIPLDVLVRRKESCYCFAGTLLAFVMCGTIGLIALGPAIALPFIARRRKRWYGWRCEVCSYDLTGTPNADCCPECGTGWKRTDD